MDNIENFRKYFLSGEKFKIEEFLSLLAKQSDKLVDWAIKCSGSYYYKLNFIYKYNLEEDPEIKSLCDQFDKTILSYIQNHIQENKSVNPVLKQLFERDYRIAISKASNKNEEHWDKIDWPDFDYDMFATNGFHYYLKAFKTLNIWQKELDWDKKEKEFWSYEDNFKKAILGYTKGWYDDNSSPWFPNHLDWWPKEFWWNDVLAYGAVVFRGKKFEDVVLYPDNLDKVEILKLK